MNRSCLIGFGALTVLWLSATHAATTIDAAHPYAYGANVGWVNARADGTNGAVIGRYYCSGYLYGSNVGWIRLGSGTPGNGYAYANNSASDYGVNHDGEGRLTGYAYGANIGWIAFEQTRGKPKVDLRTGNLSGYAWGANVGWLSLSNAQAFVRTTTLSSGPDSDHDKLPDPWEFREAGLLTKLGGGTSDQDRDGESDTEELAADTDPLAAGERLTIVALSRAGNNDTVSWQSRPTRLYRLEVTNALPRTAGRAWKDAGSGLMAPPAASPAQATVASGGAEQRFYRVRAVLPLGE